MRSGRRVALLLVGAVLAVAVGALTFAHLHLLAAGSFVAAVIALTAWFYLARRAPASPKR